MPPKPVIGKQSSGVFISNVGLSGMAEGHGLRISSENNEEHQSDNLNNNANDKENTKR